MQPVTAEKDGTSPSFSPWHTHSLKSLEMLSRNGVQFSIVVNQQIPHCGYHIAYNWHDQVASKLHYQSDVIFRWYNFSVIKCILLAHNSSINCYRVPIPPFGKGPRYEWVYLDSYGKKAMSLLLAWWQSSKKSMSGWPRNKINDFPEPMTEWQTVSVWQLLDQMWKTGGNWCQTYNYFPQRNVSTGWSGFLTQKWQTNI